MYIIFLFIYTGIYTYIFTQLKIYMYATFLIYSIYKWYVYLYTFIWMYICVYQRWTESSSYVLYMMKLLLISHCSYMLLQHICLSGAKSESSQRIVLFLRLNNEIIETRGRLQHIHVFNSSSGCVILLSLFTLIMCV